MEVGIGLAITVLVAPFIVLHNITLRNKLNKINKSIPSNILKVYLGVDKVWK